jgi:hypothetical protein
MKDIRDLKLISCTSYVNVYIKERKNEIENISVYFLNGIFIDFVPYS